MESVVSKIPGESMNRPSLQGNLSNDGLDVMLYYLSPPGGVHKPTVALFYKSSLTNVHSN